MIKTPETSETQSQTEQAETTAPARQSSRKSILAFSLFALALNSTVAVYTLSPSDFALPDISSLAELLPHQKASDPIPDAVAVALKDIQSTQQQHAASLQEHSLLLQQNTALLQQGSIALASLRQSVMDEQVDVKKVSGQISGLTAKVDSLQKAMTSDVTASIPTGRAHNRLSRVVRKKTARQPAPLGPVSLGGAPLSFPATTLSPQG